MDNRYTSWKRYHFQLIESFKAAGVYPYDPLQILKNCNTPVSDTLTQTILEKIPQLAKRLWKEGELADEDFVRAGITRAEDEVIKDHLVIYSRRSCLLTCKALVTREHQKAEAELQKKIEAAAKKARAAEIRKRKRDAQEEALANAVPLTIIVDGNLWRRRREEAESSSAC